MYIRDLKSDEIYINVDASETLKLDVGNLIAVYTTFGKSEFVVRDVVENGGLAGGGRNPYILLSLIHI